MLRRGHVTWVLNGEVWMLEEPCLLDDEYPSPYLSNEKPRLLRVFWGLYYSIIQGL